MPEAAYLAGLIRAPETADANRATDEATNASNLLTATRRRDSVLDAMLVVGSITQAEYDEAQATAFETVVPRTVQRNFGRVANPEWGTEYYVDHVRQWLVREAGFTDAEVFGGGLRVYSTIQMDRQRAASEAVNSTLDEPDDPAGALVAIDDGGAVRAMYGGNDYAASEVNLATGTLGGGGGRQPGSSFKPFALAEAVAQGIPLNKTYNAPAKLVIPEANDGEDWEVGNYGDAGLGRLDLVSATAKSSNTAYAQLMLEVGPENVVAMAKRLGITSPLDPFPATVLGTEEVSVLDMASAYSTFADDGVHIDPYVVTRVTDALGVVLWENEITRDEVLDPEQVKQVNWALNQVVEGGTGTRAQFGQPAAGKTGTTDEYKDAWFVGYTCRLTAAVWVGYPGTEERLMKDVKGIEVTGGSLPAEIWRKFMVAGHRRASSRASSSSPSSAPRSSPTTPRRPRRRRGRPRSRPSRPRPRRPPRRRRRRPLPRLLRPRRDLPRPPFLPRFRRPRPAEPPRPRSSSGLWQVSSGNEGSGMGSVWVPPAAEGRRTDNWRLR